MKGIRSDPPRARLSQGGWQVKVREVIKLIEADGWYIVVTQGDHRQFKRPIKRGRVTVADHPNDDLHPKTLASIFKQAQLPKP